MHLLETKPEMMFAHQTWGKSAVEHLWEIGLLSSSFVGAHSGWVTRQDIRLISDAGATVVYNPASNLRLFSGISPVAAMMSAGVKVAFGMDGLSLADDNDILSELRLGAVLQRFPDIMGEPLPARDVFGMATVNGASALGAGLPLGAIRPGYKADIVLLRKDAVLASSSQCVLPPVEIVLARAKGEHVDTVIIGGEMVVQAGKVCTIDRDAVHRELSAMQTEPTWEDAQVELPRAVEAYAMESLKLLSRPADGETAPLRVNAL
jgi:cytosine/adenosine deaminase-related metal-dependent hydrolase